MQAKIEAQKRHIENMHIRVNDQAEYYARMQKYHQNQMRGKGKIANDRMSQHRALKDLVLLEEMRKQPSGLGSIASLFHKMDKMDDKAYKN